MSTDTKTAHPPIVSYDEWRAARVAHLAKEKKLTNELDQLRADRRRLPMHKVEKDYKFQGPEGEVSLLNLLGDNHTLAIYHFMFDPEWEKGCPGCTSWTNGISRDTVESAAKLGVGYIHVSRAPLEKLQQYSAEKGWWVPWYSSFGSDFNYDFQATLDDNVKEPEYNFRTRDEVEAEQGKRPEFKGETPGMSIFMRVGDEVFHTYSTYERGVEPMIQSYGLLDFTPYGRQEDFEDSPDGFPQKPTYG
ncbi:MAG: DUF899 domain-containing protein [Fimbriimonadaceae bacterium]